MQKIVGFYNIGTSLSKTRINKSLNDFETVSVGSIINKYQDNNFILAASTTNATESIFNINGIITCYSGFFFPNYFPKSIEKQLYEEKILHFLNNYKESGDKTILNYNGKFNFLIYDSSKKEIKILNDEFGFHPLFYYQDKETIIFSNDYESILKFNIDLKNDLNNLSIAEYLLLGSPQNDKTFFNKIKFLPAGSSLEIGKNGLKVRRVFPKLLVRKSKLSIEDVATQYYNIFRQQLGLALKWYPDLQITLTGGADTRMILGSMEMDELLNREFVTFSSKYVDDVENQDIIISKILSKIFSLNHSVQENNFYAIDRLNEDYFLKLRSNNKRYVSGYLGSETLRPKASFPTNTSEISRALLTNSNEIYSYFTDFLVPIPNELSFKQKYAFAYKLISQYSQTNITKSINQRKIKSEIYNSLKYINNLYPEIPYLNMSIFKSFFSRHCGGARSSMLMPCYVTQMFYTPFTDSRLLKIIWSINPKNLSSEKESLTYYIFKNHLSELGKIVSNSHLGDHNDLYLPKIKEGKHTIDNISVDYTEFYRFFDSSFFELYKNMFNFGKINQDFINPNHQKSYIWKDLFSWLNYIRNL
jgi:hypothetical protein